MKVCQNPSFISTFKASYKKYHRLGCDLIITELAYSVDILLVRLQHELHQVSFASVSLLPSLLKDLSLHCYEIIDVLQRTHKPAKVLRKRKHGKESNPEGCL